MRFFAPFFLFGLFCSSVYGQQLATDSNYIIDKKVIKTHLKAISSTKTFLGNQPFWPYLVRKLSVGHPQGAIGIGLTQQYQLNPHPYRWQNQQFMQPVSGLPQYPNFVLSEFSPTISHFNNKFNMEAIQVGQIHKQGVNVQYRQVRLVRGILQ